MRVRCPKSTHLSSDCRIKCLRIRCCKDLGGNAPGFVDSLTWRADARGRMLTMPTAYGATRKRGLNSRPGPPVDDDLVERDFTASAPNQLWLTDITEHPRREPVIQEAREQPFPAPILIDIDEFLEGRLGSWVWVQIYPTHTGDSNIRAARRRRIQPLRSQTERNRGMTAIRGEHLGRLVTALISW